MDWHDMEKMTVSKLREEAMKHPQIEGAHGKTKEQLMEEMAELLGIERPHAHYSDRIIHKKGDLKHKIRDLKAEREKVIAAHDHKALHKIRRQIHDLKRKIRKMEAKALRQASN